MRGEGKKPERRRKTRDGWTHQQEDVHQKTKLDDLVMSKTSIGMTNTMMWLAMSGDVGLS